MCGFAAAIAFRGSKSPDVTRVKAMQSAIAHRGPDDDGFFAAKGVVLAHQRLSIIDVGSPPQPARTEDGRFSMVYNGEIYNYLSLRKELLDKGVYFSTQCDTEVLLKSFAMYGPSIFERLDGMFSAVIVDHKEAKVFAFRDRTGIKPLYMARDNDVVLFGSEIAAIQAYEPLGFNTLDPEAIDNYMMLGYVVEPKTHIAGIRQLPPAHYAVFDMNSGECSQHEYWSIKDAMHSSSVALSVQDGQALLECSVRSQLMSDVPVGTFLSGGLDSSLVTKIAAQEREGLGRLHCYSAGFSVSAYDEIPYALEVAQSVNAQHSTVYFDETLLSDVGKVGKFYGGPFADNAALPTYLLAKKARHDVKVLLSGDGADELFFGYRNHRSMYVEQAVKSTLPAFITEHVLKWLAKGYPNHPSMPRFMRAKSTFTSLSMPLAESYCYAMSATSRGVLSQLYTPEFKQRLDAFTTEGEFACIAGELEHHDPMKVMQYLDFRTYLPGSVLTKVDRATMRAGVEARVPFLSNAIMDNMLPQNPRLNLGWGEHKTQLREWSGKWLSEGVSGRVKCSFTSPLDNWFRTLQYPHFYRMIMTDSLVESGIFDVRKIDALMREHYRGKANHGTTLWALSVLARTLPA